MAIAFNQLNNINKACPKTDGQKHSQKQRAGASLHSHHLHNTTTGNTKDT